SIKTTGKFLLFGVYHEPPELFYQSVVLFVFSPLQDVAKPGSKSRNRLPSPQDHGQSSSVFP
ncbi:MAG: hypothetical protein Q8M92_03425, partial [Candidatus Subteraquimicrobiales bacterium]|nr:hypothetical protein [Candidatus Subteraquimicrobiales bacterium]